MNRKHLFFTIYNKFSKEKIAYVSMPFNSYKASKGAYSNMWRRFRISIASIEKVPIYHIRTTVKLITRQGARCVIELPSGFKLDMPDDINEIDYRILIMHMNILKFQVENR